MNPIVGSLSSYFFENFFDNLLDNLPAILLGNFFRIFFNNSIGNFMDFFSNYLKLLSLWFLWEYLRQFIWIFHRKILCEFIWLFLRNRLILLFFWKPFSAILLSYSAVYSFGNCDQKHALKFVGQSVFTVRRRERECGMQNHSCSRIFVWWTILR